MTNDILKLLHPYPFLLEGLSSVLWPLPQAAPEPMVPRSEMAATLVLQEDLIDSLRREVEDLSRTRGKLRRKCLQLASEKEGLAQMILDTQEKLIYELEAQLYDARNGGKK